MKKIRRPMLVLAISQILLLLFLNWMDGRGQKLLPEEEIRVIGKVFDINFVMREKGRGYDITIKSLTPPYRKLLIRVSETQMKAYLKRMKREDKRLRIGDKVEAVGQFQHFRKARNDGGFDADFYYSMEGYDGLVKLKKPFVITGETSGFFWDKTRDFFYQLRTKLSEKFRVILGEREGGSLAAMILGDRGFLDPEVKDLYASHSISHLLAISGLHISIIGFLIYFLCKSLSLPFFFSNFIPILFLVFYGFLSGFSVSATRAIIMMSILFLSYLFRRSYDIESALSLSGILMLSYHPKFLFQASFQLSFVAVLSIIYGVKLTEKIFGKEEKKSKWDYMKAYLTSSSVGTTTIQFIMLPVLLWHFYEVSLNGIFLNMLVIPLMSVLVAAGLIGGFFSLFSVVLGGFFLGSTDFILKLYDFSCRFMEINPWNKVILGRPSIKAVVLYYAILIFAYKILNILNDKEYILFLRGEINKKDKKDLKRAKQIGILILLPFAFFLLTHGEKKAFSKRLDVGRGSCKVIRDNEKREYIVNCGSSSLKQVGKFELIPFLKFHGIRRVEGVFVTGFEKEQVSGLGELLIRDEIQVSKIIVPKEMKEEIESKVYLREIFIQINRRKIPVYFLSDGIERREGGYRYSFQLDKQTGIRRLKIRK